MFLLLLARIGYTPFVACECGTEEHAADHVILQRLLHQPHYRLHGLTVLDETLEWLLKI